MRSIVSIDRVAGAQHGVISRRPLLTHAWDSSRIARELRARRLHRLHAGVYAVGHRALSSHGRWMAAVLACAPDGVLSHHSAAALWGLPVRDNGLTRVTATHRRRRAGIVIHRATLAHEDVTVHRGIRVTTVARTLADLAVPSMTSATTAPSRRRSSETCGSTRRSATRSPGHGHVASRTTSATRRSPRRTWKTRSYASAHATTNALQLAGYVVPRYTHQDVTRRKGLVAGQVRRALRLA
jgi:hypothetical protein